MQTPNIVIYSAPNGSVELKAKILCGLRRKK